VSFTLRSRFWRFGDFKTSRFKAQLIAHFAGFLKLAGWSRSGCGSGNSGSSIGKFGSNHPSPAGLGFPER
jgi:hypothetical protein